MGGNGGQARGSWLRVSLPRFLWRHERALRFLGSHLEAVGGAAGAT